MDWCSGVFRAGNTDLEVICLASRKSQKRQDCSVTMCSEKSNEPSIEHGEIPTFKMRNKRQWKGLVREERRKKQQKGQNFEAKQNQFQNFFSTTYCMSLNELVMSLSFPVYYIGTIWQYPHHLHRIHSRTTSGYQKLGIVLNPIYVFLYKHIYDKV